MGEGDTGLTASQRDRPPPVTARHCAIVDCYTKCLGPGTSGKLSVEGLPASLPLTNAAWMCMHDVRPRCKMLGRRRQAGTPLWLAMALKCFAEPGALRVGPSSGAPPPQTPLLEALEPRDSRQRG